MDRPHQLRALTDKPRNGRKEGRGLTSYQVDTPTITLNNPTKAGYIEWWFPKMEADLIEILAD